MTSITDPISILPFEITSQIFHFVGVNDALFNCTRVCKTWKAFLSSNRYWINLILDEFDEKVATDYIKANDGIATNLRKLLQTEWFASNHFISNNELPNVYDFYGPTIGPLENFIRLLASKPLPDSSPPLFRVFNDQEDLQMFVINLQALFGSCRETVLDFYLYLQPCLAFVCLWPKMRVAFLDKQLRLHSDILTTETEHDKSGPLIRIKPGTLYIVAEAPVSFATLRFLMPSQSRRLQKFVTLMSLIRRHEVDNAYYQRLEAIRAILREDPALANWSMNGLTPLMRASSVGTVQAVQTLLDYGADMHKGKINLNDPGQLLWPCLSYAASCANTEIMKLLLDNGADPNAKTGLPLVSPVVSTPLYSALLPMHKAGPNIEAAKLLIERGADVNAKLRDAENPLLTFTILHRRDSCALFLLENGADPSLKNKYGQTALDVCEYGSVLWHLVYSYYQKSIKK